MKDKLEKETLDYHQELINSLKDTAEATAYLKIALEEYEEDKDPRFFLIALRNVAEARGGITELSRKTVLNRQNIYRALSGRGNPTFQTLDTIVHGLGFRLSVEPLNPSVFDQQD